jgi:hypothetical protein
VILPRNPLRRRAPRNGCPYECSAVESDNHESIEKAECNSGNDEQIHGRDLRRMVAEKRPPALTWRSAAAPNHVLGDGRLSYLKAKFQQFAMNARRAPERIINAHLTNEPA